MFNKRPSKEKSLWLFLHSDLASKLGFLSVIVHTNESQVQTNTTLKILNFASKFQTHACLITVASGR